MATAFLGSDGRVWLDTEWRERELVKKVPGAKYDDSARKWHLPCSWATCVTLRGVFEDRLEIDPSLNQWAYEERQRRIEPCMALRDAATVDEDHPVRVTLRTLGIQ